MFELLGEELNSTYFPNGMTKNNNESQTGPHPISTTPVNLETPMSDFRERLEALHLMNGNRSRSQVEETNPPTGIELTNLLLLELVQKHWE